MNTQSSVMPNRSPFPVGSNGFDPNFTKNPPNPLAASVASQQTLEAVQVLSVLAPTEQKQLAECEAIIAKGWQTFLEVGQALAIIRDKRLYRAQYGSFEGYCRLKWQYGKSHVYRLISAAEVVAYLSPIGDVPVPINESQVRPLIGLPAEQAQAAWKQALGKAGGKTVTARLVKEAVAELAGNPATQSCKSTVKKGPANMRRQRWSETMKLFGEIEEAVQARENTKSVLRLLEKFKQQILELRGT